MIKYLKRFFSKKLSAGRGQSTYRRATPISKLTKSGAQKIVPMERLEAIAEASNLMKQSPLVGKIAGDIKNYTVPINWKASTGDKSLNEDIESYLKLALSKENIDYRGMLNFYEILELIELDILRQGSVGINLVQDSANPFEGFLKMQLISTLRIGKPTGRESTEFLRGKNYMNGFEFDSRSGTFIGVHVFDNDRSFFIEKNNFLYRYLPQSYEQYICFPEIFTAINKIIDRDEIKLAESAKIKFWAKLIGFFKNDTGENNLDPASMSGNEALGSDEDGPIKQRNLTVGDKTTMFLGMNEELQLPQNAAPPEALNKYIAGLESDAANAINIPAGWLGIAGKSQGTDIRLRIEQFMAVIAKRRVALKAQVLDNLMSKILSRGRLQGFYSGGDEIFDGQWIFPKEISIDRGRDKKTAIEDVKFGIKSATQLILENGNDPDKTFEMKKNETERLISTSKDIAKRLDVSIDFVIQQMRQSTTSATYPDTEIIDETE